MADTLLEMSEAAKGTDPFTGPLQQIIVEENPMLDFVRFKQLPQGNNSYQWFRDDVLPTASFRAVNAGWDAKRGIIVSKQEPLSILGLEVEIDQYILDTMGGALSPDQKARQYEMAMRASHRLWETTFFEGDRGVTPDSFDGLRVRATESTMDFDMSSGTDRAAMTLAKIDEILGAVVGGPTIIVSNEFLRRKMNALVRAAGQATEPVSRTFGKAIPSYADIPWVIQQRESDMTSILGFDEDPGDGGDDAASLYAIRFGDEEHVFGILGHGGAWEVRDFGEQQASPRNLGRLSVYVGLVTAHPRSFARLNSLAQL